MKSNKLKNFMRLLFCVFVIVGRFFQADAAVSKLDELDAWIVQEMKADQMPGFQFTFFSKDKILLSRSYGVTRVASATPLTDQHVMRIASISKLFTAIAIANLIDQKKLSLNTKLFEVNVPFIHWLKKQKLNSKKRWQEFTIADLLGHTSGLSIDAGGVNMWWDIEMLKRGNFPSWAEIERGIGKVRVVNIAPNQLARSKYSNVGPIILSRIVAELSDSNEPPDIAFQNRIHTLILEPLGMKSTTYSLRNTPESLIASLTLK